MDQFYADPKFWKLFAVCFALWWTGYFWGRFVQKQFGARKET